MPERCRSGTPGDWPGALSERRSELLPRSAPGAAHRVDAGARLYLKIPSHEIQSAQNPVLKIPSNIIPSVSKSRQIKSRRFQNPVKQNPVGLKIPSNKIPSVSKSRQIKSRRSQNPVDLKIPSYEIPSVSKSCRSQILSPKILSVSKSRRSQNPFGSKSRRFESTIMKIN